MKLLSLDHSASRWQSWASNLSLTPTCLLFAKTGIVAALFELGVTGFLNHVYMWVAGQSEGIQEIEEDSAREFSEVHWCSTHRWPNTGQPLSGPVGAGGDGGSSAFIRPPVEFILRERHSDGHCTMSKVGPPSRCFF